MATTPERAGWLFKVEPGCYSFADLQRDGATLWDGVTNALARKHLRMVRKGDRILYYHTGKEKAIVGEMLALSDPQPDVNAGDSAAVVLRVKPLRRWPAPLTLERIKKDAHLARWELVRLPRLSVLPVSREQWDRVENLAQQSG